MASPKPLTDDEGEIRELTSQDSARAVPYSALPEEVKDLLNKPDRAVISDNEQDSKSPAA